MTDKSNCHEIAIIGAGIAGIATAYYLSVIYQQKNIILIDRDQPLAFTTSKSGENFRDYWPQQCMASLARRSIELMTGLAQETGNVFNMRNTGYQFASFHKDREIFPSSHLRDSGHSGEFIQIDHEQELRTRFPYLSDQVAQIVHVVLAGSMDIQALGQLMLSKARDCGVELLRYEIDGISKQTGKFKLAAGNQPPIECNRLVLAAGPMNSMLAAQLDVDLGIESILQRKFVIPDPLKIIPRDMPYTIFSDSQYLDWSDEEEELIQGDPEFEFLLEEFPPGLHIKPESGKLIKLGWAFNRESQVPLWQPPDDFDFPNITLRGASKFIPALKAYVEKPPTPVVQYCGYYSRTPENWPVIGPLEEHDGLYTVAALSGFGTMMACAAGELLAGWMLDKELPEYASHFHRNRYQNPEILEEINAIESDGQL
jgi:glycine/D-amino acid oxidase-like deaminating enzyme